MTANKYRNKPFRDADGMYWHSRGEYKRWQELLLLQRAGKIDYLLRQFCFVFEHNNVEIGKWIADFTYLDREKNCQIAEDFKGVITADFRRNVKCMKAWEPGWKIRVSSTKGVRDI